MSVWMVRAGHGGIYAQLWRDTGIVAIRWTFGGRDVRGMNYEQLRDAHALAHPTESAASVSSAASQVHHFLADMTEGTRVVTYDPATREYLIGSVTGDWYESTDDEVSYVRPVQWYGAASRDALPTDARARLGAGTTIFRISEEVATELARAAGVQGWGGAPQVQRFGRDVQVVETSRVDETPPVGLDDDARAASADDGIERIKDRVLDLEWDQMEALTAGLLRAMGYYSRITARGPDGGRDVIATPDALGLESPHIVAEVKHRKSAMGTPEIRSFIGGLRPGDRGLYVSTGGFTRDARLEADRSNIPVRLIDLDDFVRLYTDVYDRVDEETRALLPLVRIWWPA
jgi:hypothetical protein